MRLFFALWPPAETAAALARWSTEVMKTAGGKVTAVDKIHLTLAFLGDAEDSAARAAAAAVRGRRFDLPIDSAKYVKRNRMVWVGPAEVPQALSAIVNSLQGRLLEGGFALEARPYVPHVTLLRGSRLPAALPPLPSGPWPITEVLLVRSVEGRYEKVAHYPLG